MNDEQLYDARQEFVSIMQRDFNPVVITLDETAGAFHQQLSELRRCLDDPIVNDYDNIVVARVNQEIDDVSAMASNLMTRVRIAKLLDDSNIDTALDAISNSESLDTEEFVTKINYWNPPTPRVVAQYRNAIAQFDDELLHFGDAMRIDLQERLDELLAEGEADQDAHDNLYEYVEQSLAIADRLKSTNGTLVANLDRLIQLRDPVRNAKSQFIKAAGVRRTGPRSSTTARRQYDTAVRELVDATQKLEQIPRDDIAFVSKHKKMFDVQKQWNKIARGMIDHIAGEQLSQKATVLAESEGHESDIREAVASLKAANDELTEYIDKLNNECAITIESSSVIKSDMQIDRKSVV